MLCRLLVIFCLISLINYLDRGAIASNGVNGHRQTCAESGICTGGSGIQGEFKLNNFEDGVISSAFMVGLLVASPVFASLAKRYALFLFHTFIDSLHSEWFWENSPAEIRYPENYLCSRGVHSHIVLSVARLVGVGEASFISLAAPFIDDNAPDTQVGSHLAWRWAFWMEAILMIPFVILGFVMKPLQLKGFATARSENALSTVETSASDVQDTETSITDCSETPLRAKDNNLGETSKSEDQKGNDFTRFVNDMKALLVEKVYVINVLDMIFGGITVGCGLAGSIGGGLLLDYMTSSISNAFKAPVNFVCLHCVKPSLRPLSMAMSTVAIHVFGDVPSSPLVGVLQDHINNWRKTALILTAILFLAATIWFIGIFLHGADKFYEESEDNVSVADKTNEAPLLEEKNSTA
ncbi:hypothetical protein Cgig2_019478 [Carnegiea gigantea]|uniref:Uncharacterized protein n=1 Tax=Carnegiea gigantea TaxID=171969 RepID=A0A9Q1KPU1_9CARY|nr:hypothetical protein Cgig2_019478 [Carnegiea gigantea]